MTSLSAQWQQILQTRTFEEFAKLIPTILCRGDTPLLQQLYDLCQDRQVYSRSADISLIYAIEDNYPEAVDFFLCRGVKVPAEALRLASLGGKTEIVKILLAHGADIHADNDIALRWACTNGHTDTAQFLLDQGANIHADNVLYWTCGNGHHATVRLLLTRGAKVTDHDFRIASERGHVDVVKELLVHDFYTGDLDTDE